MSILSLVLRSLIIVVVGILVGVLGNYIFKIFDSDHDRQRWLYVRRILTAFIVLLVITIFMQWLILEENSTASETIRLAMNLFNNWRTTQVSMQSLLIASFVSFCCGMVFYAMAERLVRVLRENRAARQLKELESPTRIPSDFK